MSAAVMEAVAVAKSFGGIRAVDSVSLWVGSGEILGIIGPNGAGKTALINTITGFYRADAGAIKYRGGDITRLSMHRIGRLGIARTFQNIRLFRRLSVLENVLAGAQVYARAPFRSVFALRRRKSDIDNALDHLAAVGLAQQANRAAGALSYGEARRLEIARALATGPRLLLLDEPAAGMNENESAVLVRNIDELRRRLDAVVLIEHDMTVVRDLSDRLVALDAGRVLAEGRPRDVLSHPLVSRAYLGEEAEADAGHP